MAGYAWLGLIGAALAYILWFRGVGSMPAGAVAFLPLISPLVAAVLGWLLLSETLTSFQGAGFALALLAVSCAQRTPSWRGAPPNLPTPPHVLALDPESAVLTTREHTA